MESLAARAGPEKGCPEGAGMFGVCASRGCAQAVVVRGREFEKLLPQLWGESWFVRRLMFSQTAFEICRVAGLLRSLSLS